MQKAIDLLKRALNGLRTSHGKRLAELERRVSILEKDKVDRWKL